MKQKLNHWPLIDSYFGEKSIAKQEIDSFNQFLDQKLMEIVEENKTVIKPFSLVFSMVEFLLFAVIAGLLYWIWKYKR